MTRSHFRKDGLAAGWTTEAGRPVRQLLGGGGVSTEAGAVGTWKRDWLPGC